MPIREELAIDPAVETDRIASFIRSQLEAAGRSTIVIGLSGGVDSSVTGFLCARAAGGENVLGFMLPQRSNPTEDIRHARAGADAAGIRAETIDITPAVDALHKMLSADDRVRLGNAMARVRMIVLYDRSALHRALVAGTGNRTETMLGYTTLNGDSACAFAPIAHLYKCQVRQLAAHLGVPQEVIQKPPKAGLWPGQTDEAELGLTYDEADWLLFNLLDKTKNDPELEAMGFSADFIGRVKGLIARSEFKRRLPSSLLSQD